MNCKKLYIIAIYILQHLDIKELNFEVNFRV